MILNPVDVRGGRVCMAVNPIHVCMLRANGLSCKVQPQIQKKSNDWLANNDGNKRIMALPLKVAYLDSLLLLQAQSSMYIIVQNVM